MPWFVQGGRVVPMPVIGLPVTGTHSPLPLQVSHWPAQAEMQHTPSTQLPLAHWVAAVQVDPCGNGAGARSGGCDDARSSPDGVEGDGPHAASNASATTSRARPNRIVPS
jgi:hypothetical protein